MKKMVEELVGGRPQQTMKTAVWPSDEEVLGSTKHQTTLSKNQLIIEDTETESIFRICVNF